VIQFGGACGRHRPALLDFVDRAEIGPGTDAALAHLDLCARCTTHLEKIVQTITALHRIGDEAGHVEPADDAWPRLRDRLTRWRPGRWKVMSPIAGTAMSLALLVVLLVPLRFGATTTISPNLDRLVASPAERRIEANYISTSRRGSTLVHESAARPTGGGPRNYPDGFRPQRKEVAPAEPSGLAPAARTCRCRRTRPIPRDRG
jgi:hypothetical protein